jgi:hypothetical protein
VVDLLDSSYAWFGNGFAEVGALSSGKTKITVTPSLVVDGSSYTVKVWIVSSSVYTADPSNAWMQEIVSDVSQSVTFKEGQSPPLPSLSPGKCRNVWAQCGGSGYQGQTCCVTGSSCRRYSESWWQCTPVPDMSSPSSCSALWDQCGGESFSGPTCCAEGSTCKSVSSKYSQCVPPGFSLQSNPIPTAPRHWSVLSGCLFGAGLVILTAFSLSKMHSSKSRKESNQGIELLVQ